MTKRTRSACIGIAMLAAGSVVISSAQARPSSSEASGAARSCLTGEARNLLARIEQQFGAMQIISTCRPGAKIAGTGRTSRHASGNAVDFNAGGRKGAVIQWLIANHHQGGTMTYPSMDHIHVDIGPRFVSLAGSRTRVAAGPSEKWQGRMSLGAKRGSVNARSARSESGRSDSERSGASSRSSAAWKNATAFSGSVNTNN